MRLARRITAVEESPTLALGARAKEMQAQGIAVADFALGEPDFPTPEHIKEAAARALRENFTRYTAAAGTKELRQAICQKLSRDNGLGYKPEEVVVSCGAKHSLYNLLQVLCEEGDEVVVIKPYWVSYPEMVKLAGARPVLVDTEEAAGFKLSPESLKRALNPRTRAVILNSPSNPAGIVYSRKELEELAGLLEKSGAVVISDEIYEKLVYNGAEHVSIASLSRELFARTVTVNGHSKAFAMTGWRIGYAAGPVEIISAAAKLQSQSTSNPTSIAQAAALAALTDSRSVSEVERMRQEFERRLELLLRRLAEIPGITCVEPEGAFYVFFNVSKLFGRHLGGAGGAGGASISSAGDFAAAALTQARVALVPGEGFGSERHVRLSYATSREVIEQGMKSLREMVG